MPQNSIAAHRTIKIRRMARAMATVAVTLQGHEGISYACDWCFLQISGRPGVRTFAIRKNTQPCLIHKAYAELREERQQLQRDSAQRRIAASAGKYGDAERQRSAASAPRKPQGPSPFGAADKRFFASKAVRRKRRSTETATGRTASRRTSA